MKKMSVYAAIVAAVLSELNGILGLSSDLPGLASLLLMVFMGPIPDG